MSILCVITTWYFAKAYYKFGFKIYNNRTLKSMETLVLNTAVL
jgi:hypothetical protein